MGSSGQRRRARIRPVGTPTKQPAERRQPAVPDLEDLTGVGGVGREVGEHVEQAGPDDRGGHDPEEHAGEPLGGVAVGPQPPLEVAVGEPERHRQPDAVGVDHDGRGPEVEGDGDGLHGGPWDGRVEAPRAHGFSVAPTAPRLPVGARPVGPCRARRAKRPPLASPRRPGRGRPGRGEEDGMGALEGKVAIVTGGASGIGLASSRRLTAEGATVVVVDANGDGAEKAASELGRRRRAGRRGQGRATGPRIVDAARRLGGIDIAYLNAGVTTGEEDITKVTDEQYRRILSVNVDGIVFGTRAVVPELVARGGGAIVATSSLAGHRGLRRRPHVHVDQARRGGVRARRGAAPGRAATSPSTPSAPAWSTRRSSTGRSATAWPGSGSRSSPPRPWPRPCSGASLGGGDRPGGRRAARPRGRRLPLRPAPRASGARRRGQDPARVAGRRRPGTAARGRRLTTARCAGV